MTDLPTTKTDFLIVGQGIAGTLLSHFLLLENQIVRVIDKPFPGATSNIAAGVINPVTGRRMAKSWRFEELYPVAKQTYLELDQILGINAWKEPNILRALPSVFEENEWARRGIWPEHKNYFCNEADLANFEGKVNTERSWGELEGSAQVSLPEIIKGFRNLLIGKGAFNEEEFDYDQLKIVDEGVLYKSHHYHMVIFCEGSKALQNPYFNYLPFAPTKGECLLVRIPGANFKKLLKNHIFIVPLAGEKYWVGSTSRFEFEGPNPTEEKREYLKKELKRVLKVPFEIVEHQAGIRPTISDKRPLLGLHPKHSCLGIFNGLGTKGASLGPFFSRQLTGFLLGKNALDPAVDIQRFA